jgi:hypothetical protein
MIKAAYKCSAIVLGTIFLLVSQPADAAVCLIGECSAMTTEFRNLELRPRSIALLPPLSSLKKKGVFATEDQVGETAQLELALTREIEKQLSSRGYQVRTLTAEEINADAELKALLSNANQRYNEEYGRIVALKVSGVKYRRFSVGNEARLLARYLKVDAVAFPRMQAVGGSGAAIVFSPTGGGQINMEFALVHARTGDIEAFFGAINSGGLFGKSLNSILEKPDKHMAKISKTATKKMPDVDKALKPDRLKEEPKELVLYDDVDEESVLDDLEGLLDTE